MRHETLGKEPAGSSLERVKPPSSTGFPRATSKRGVASGAANRGLRDGREQAFTLLASASGDRTTPSIEGPIDGEVSVVVSPVSATADDALQLLLGQLALDGSVD